MEPDSSVTSKFPVLLFNTTLPITSCLSTFDDSKKDFDDSVEKSYWSGELGFSYRCLRFCSWARCRSSNICLSEWIERKYFSNDDKAPFRFRFSEVLKLKKNKWITGGSQIAELYKEWTISSQVFRSWPWSVYWVILITVQKMWYVVIS